MKKLIGILILLFTLTSAAFAQTEPAPGRLIAVLKVGTGTGTVVTNVGGVNCGVAPAPVVCLSTFRIQPGTPITVTSTPSVGSTFAGWIGLPVACPTTTCSFKMPRTHVQIQVTFNSTTNNPPDTVLPDTPVLEGSVTSATSLTLKWFGVKDNRSLAGYELHRCKGVDIQCTTFTAVGGTILNFFFLDTGLTAETSYVYRLRSVDNAGNRSAWSKILTIATPKTGTTAWATTSTGVNVTLQQTAADVTRTVSVINTGTQGVTVDWSASVDWMKIVSPATYNLRIAPGATANFTVTFSAAAPWTCAAGCPLPAGTYTSNITLTGDGGITQTIPVVFTVTAAAPTITRTPSTITFTKISGQANPPTQTFQITNTGGGSLAFTLTKNTGTGWLAMTPTTGTAPATITLTATQGNRAAGTYNATITITATGATNTPQTVAVQFIIQAAPVPPAIGLSATSFTFTSGVNGTPASQTLNITNTGGGTLSYTVSENTEWLTVAPLTGTAPSAVTLSVSTVGLAAGTYTGTVSVASTGASNTPQTVTVTLTITAPTGSAVLLWDTNTATDLAGFRVYRSTTSGVYGAPLAQINCDFTNQITTYTDTTGFVGTTYFFVVTAFDTNGNESPFSNEVSKTY